MNNICISGRLTKNVELVTTENERTYARFSVAVNNGKNANGEVQTDFFNCVARGQTADQIAKYFSKGSPIEICGSMNSRQWEGKTFWDINVRGWSFPQTNKETKEKTDEQETTATETQPPLPF